MLKIKELGKSRKSNKVSKREIPIKSSIKELGKSRKSNKVSKREIPRKSSITNRI